MAMSQEHTAALQHYTSKDLSLCAMSLPKCNYAGGIEDAISKGGDFIPSLDKAERCNPSKNSLSYKKTASLSQILASGRNHQKGKRGLGERGEERWHVLCLECLMPLGSYRISFEQRAHADRNLIRSLISLSLAFSKSRRLLEILVDSMGSAKMAKDAEEEIDTGRMKDFEVSTRSLRLIQKRGFASRALRDWFWYIVNARSGTTLIIIFTFPKSAKITGVNSRTVPPRKSRAMKWTIVHSVRLSGG